MEYPTTAKGVLVLVSLALIGIIAIFATGLWTIAIGAVLVTVASYLVYAIGLRLHRWLSTGSAGSGY